MAADVLLGATLACIEASSTEKGNETQAQVFLPSKVSSRLKSLVSCECRTSQWRPPFSRFSTFKAADTARGEVSGSSVEEDVATKVSS